jgi:hypothetical protein
VCALATTFVACADKRDDATVVEQVKLRPGENRPTIHGENVPSVSVELTLNKAALFNQEYLFGADLQHSTFYEKEYELTLQAVTIGHIPARFRIAGNELQLISDSKLAWKSDINHPEKLLSRFKILTETETTLVVSAARSESLLAEVFQAQGGPGVTAPTASLTRDSWVRSFQFDANGNYLLQETSIVLTDGTIAEFMESIFPRSNLNPSSSFDLIEMNPENPAGADEGPAARYRFIGSQAIYRGEKTLSFAQRFDIGANATIDWYATANTPNEYLKAIQAGVEGWNRYFRSFAGIERDVVRFLGRLPNSVKLGDPRYNIILWDSRLQAGAAYESQASDPESGRQSHSLIYLPAMWARTGRDYWTTGQFSDPQVNTRRPEAKHQFKRACIRDLRERLDILLSGRLSSKEEVENFGKRLLTQTLFHEVGHALGLDHNFKGSLTFNRSEDNPVFSSSIMDYNDYEVERGAFKNVDSAEGPLLEYDRQAISALYHQAKDVTDSSPELPACNDAEADSEEDGIDPLCVRFDVEHDPTAAIETARNRIHEREIEGDVSASQAMDRVIQFLFPPAERFNVRTKEQYKKATEMLAKGIKNTLRFHLFSGRQSFFVTTSMSVRTLLLYQDDILPESYSAQEIREKTLLAIQEGLELKTLSPFLQGEARAVQEVALYTLTETPYASTLPLDQFEEELQAATKTLGNAIASIETDEKAGLPAARARLLASLARNPKVPYFLDTTDTAASASYDFETILVTLLSEASTRASLRTNVERLAATTALATYKGRASAESLVRLRRLEFRAERRAATTNAEREFAEALLALLN